MKIAVNIQPMLHSGKSGIGFYETEILKALIDENKNDEYILNYFDLKKNKAHLIEKYMKKGVTAESCNWFSASAYQLMWSFIPVPYTLFFKSEPQISAFFNYYLPPFARGKRVLVIYDTVINDYPETVRFKTKTMLKLTLKPSIRRAHKIITISEFSKKQIMKHYGVDEDKIVVVPCAADNEKYYPMTGCDEKITRIAEKYGIKGDYFLYLGNLEPRKNIVRLISAYHKARELKSDLPELVLAGGKGWLYDEIFAKVKELKLENHVIFTGYVSDEDVPYLMNGTRAFCFPSLYEGFGMPPLEAMSCGVPVIVSDCSSLPEVVGDCGIRVDPCSEDEIANALIKICDKDFAEEQGRAGLEQAKQFSWKKSAEILRNTFKELMNE